MTAEQRLLSILAMSEDEIYDECYATVDRCPVCNRALGDDDCDRETDLPPRGRMCFAAIEDDPTCVPGLR